MFSMIGPRVIFCIFSISFNKETILKQSQNIRWNYYIAGSILHPAKWTRAPCECWQRRRWTKLFGWNVMHCL